MYSLPGPGSCAQPEGVASRSRPLIDGFFSRGAGVEGLGRRIGGGPLLGTHSCVGAYRCFTCATASGWGSRGAGVKGV